MLRARLSEISVKLHSKLNPNIDTFGQVKFNDKSIRKINFLETILLNKNLKFKTLITRDISKSLSCGTTTFSIQIPTTIVTTCT